jgi:pimeloyl-ACP methyl ester carboxylesterase
LFDKPFTRSDGEVFQVRKVLQDRLIEDLRKARASAERVVLISHSMGTMIAYDCLRNRPDCPQLDGLITLGSPLGLDEVQDGLRPTGQRTVDFPAERLTGEWVNVYDRFDPVCAANPHLANDYLDGRRERVTDLNEQNWGEWRHTITHYLKGPQFRATLRRLAKF